MAAGPLATTVDDFAQNCDDGDNDGSGWCAPGDPIVFTTFSDYPTYLQTQESGWESQNQSGWQDYETAPYTPPVDLSLQCYKDVDIDFTQQASVPQSFMPPKIANFCSEANGLSLNNDSQKMFLLPYPVPSTNNFVVWLGALWNIGDLNCPQGRGVNESECNDQLSTVLNGCDTESITNKYGGSRVNQCVVWAMGIDGTGPANPQAGQTFSCTVS